MPPFIHENFLLRSATARRLYHEFARSVPIIGYHCHLDPRDLAADRRFETIAQLWVTSDPSKHRAMRIAGVPERAITGDASEREKFDRWAATVPQTLVNPLHHWTALELQRYFDLDAPISAAHARAGLHDGQGGCHQFHAVVGCLSRTGEHPGEWRRARLLC